MRLICETNLLSLISLWFDNVVIQYTCANNWLIRLNKFVSRITNGFCNLIFYSIIWFFISIRTLYTTYDITPWNFGFKQDLNTGQDRSVGLVHGMVPVPIPSFYLSLDCKRNQAKVVTVGRSFGWGQKWHCGRVHWSQSTVMVMDMQQPVSPFTAPVLKTLLPCAGMTTCYKNKYEAFMVPYLLKSAGFSRWFCGWF